MVNSGSASGLCWHAALNLCCGARGHVQTFMEGEGPDACCMLHEKIFFLLLWYFCHLLLLLSDTAKSFICLSNLLLLIHLLVY